MSETAIATRGLQKRFGPTLAVADLSLSVRAGEAFGFLGPNGAGKTTSIKMLLALVEPSGGTGTVLGAPLGDRAVRARIGFLPEHFRFHEYLTARELLRFHGRLYGLRGLPLDARIEDLLVRVDMLDAADRPLRGYSKGMLQRTGLAQALINDPALVFLDEPTSGLDPLGRLLVRDIVSELRARGTTVFVNSHLLGEVEATCDRVAFVKQGRVIHELALAGAPAGLELEMRVRPVDVEVVEGLGRFGTSVTVVGDNCVRMRVSGEHVIPDIARWLVERGVSVFALQGRRKSLEEWFVEVMGTDQRPG
ncbi:MAG: ABC transporter [Acidobacteria bacterium RIFCSPLOWO2_02_FULL_67_36]|nr:MAG: ABC transporter [Acidobacteria bacterium RIFCSPLOWO2_02_FULL_67_36]OFW23564.1 MAG: ABC transporter [Acidobacteria bacterium RIFCSPLOWO2_12_FULL_66_21]